MLPRFFDVIPRQTCPTYALPQLGLLADIAANRLSGETEEAITMSERLEANLPHMLEEHRAIVEALAALERAARSEGHAGVLGFVENLKVHAQTEEQVLHPASILVGEYLKNARGR